MMYLDRFLVAALTLGAQVGWRTSGLCRQAQRVPLTPHLVGPDCYPGLTHGKIIASNRRRSGHPAYID